MEVPGPRPRRGTGAGAWQDVFSVSGEPHRVRGGKPERVVRERRDEDGRSVVGLKPWTRAGGCLGRPLVLENRLQGGLLLLDEMGHNVRMTRVLGPHQGRSPVHVRGLRR